MTGGTTEHHSWQRALEALSAEMQLIRRIVVVERAASTQDEVRARCSGAEAGVACVALQQDAGRGRLGREWVDVPGCGVALSVALHGRGRADETMSVRTGVAVAEALESLAPRRRDHHTPLVGLKWPNDLEIGGRKVGGILIERSGDVLVVGVGINVLHQALPESIAARATSLALSGWSASRLDVVIAILRALDVADAWTPEEVASRFAARDRLTGTRATFATANGIVEGVVLRVDAWSGLEVRTASGTVFLPAQTTTVLPNGS